ncbi:hypothetical protein ACIA48_18490 [Mycobacterium sp. NPDC051804]|uniref:hypothetical protein n=1 Tax=Mycobacterium sp. NPDC051804 TaxID=3364295 RepID=UPI0037AF24FB
MVSKAPAALLTGAAAVLSLAAVSTPSTAGAQPSYPTDDRGFVDSQIRCDAPQSAVAFSRTEQSIVAICVDQAGRYQYRGARVADKDAVLTVVAEPTVPGEFFAQKDGVTYTVTAQNLVIKTPEWTRTEPVVQFGTQPLLAVEAPTAPR